MPEPKIYFKFQIFTLNDEEWRVKLFDEYKINPSKNCFTFWEFQNFFTLLLGGYNFSSIAQIFNLSTDSENLETKPSMNIKWSSWFGHSGRRESQNKKGAPRIRGPRDDKLKLLIFLRISLKLDSLHFSRGLVRNLTLGCQSDFWSKVWPKLGFTCANLQNSRGVNWYPWHPSNKASVF